jgi:predicted N-acetyltransferase YhbS
VRDSGDSSHLARIDGVLVGAVRLCEEEGALVLRGMHVAPGEQGNGIGRALLEACCSAIGDRECWCVPYTHLRAFYAAVGFAEVSTGAAPDFLVQRAESYRSQGQGVLVALRPAGFAAG